MATDRGPRHDLIDSSPPPLTTLIPSRPVGSNGGVPRVNPSTYAAPLSGHLHHAFQGHYYLLDFLKTRADSTSK